MAALLSACVAEGAVLKQRTPTYLYVSFTSTFPGAPPDTDVEFLLQTDGDATAAVRAAARVSPAGGGGGARPDLGRTAARLFRIRQRLDWPEVYVMRSRGVGVMETPLDAFGPVPPAGGADYSALDDPLAV
jgi:hypothetical protein